MPKITLYLKEAEIRAEVSGILTSGMVGVEVKLVCDDSWYGLQKTLVCRAGDITKTVFVKEDCAVVAHETMVAGKWLELGVEGISDDGSVVIPTLWERCCIVLPGVDSEADPTVDPTMPIWAQLQRRVSALEIPPVPSDIGALPGPLAAKVGQHFQVAAVNKIGMVTAVEAVDMPSGGEYALPLATAETLGGVKAEPVTENDTQPVRIGEDGMLYTAPGGIPSAGNARETTVLAEFTLTEDVDGTIRIPLSANPFAYSALLIEIRSQLMTGGGTQYMGQLYGGGKHSQIFHLNTVFDASSVKTVYVMTHLFHDAVHSIAAKKGDYMWNTTNHYTDVYPIETPADATECVLEIKNCSAVSGATFKVQGVK